MEFPPQFRKAAEARCVGEVSLHRDPERPGVGEVSLHRGPERLQSEAVKVKPRFHWRPQDIGGARAVRAKES